MARFKTCDYCKQPEGQVQFRSNEGCGNTIANVQFIDAEQKRHNIEVCVEINQKSPSSIDNSLDLCDSCRMKIVDVGLADILAQRQNAARGVFIAGAAAKVGNGPR